MKSWLKIVLGLWLLTLGALASAQSELTITGEQLMSGAAANQIRTFGRVAAAAKLPVQISAPSYWHERIAKELRTGSGDAPLELSYVDIFNEIVLLRSGGESIGSPTSQATPAPVAAAQTPEVPAAPSAPPPTPSVTAAPVVAAVERPVATVAAPTLPEPETPRPVLAPSPAAAAVAAPAATEPAVSTTAERAIATPAAAETAVSAPATTPSVAAPAANPAPAVEVAAPAAETAAAPALTSSDGDRAALQRALDASLAIELEIGIDGLEPGDTLYVRNSAIAVQRPRGQRSDWYWLGEALSLDRPELAPLRDNVYKVTRRVASGESTTTAQPERTREQELASFARALNGGQAIDETIKVEDLLPDDVLYRGQKVTVVIRPGRTRTERFVLEGEIDYTRSELRLEASNRYRVNRALR